MRLNELFLVGAGSFVGGNARYLVARAAASRFGADFPYGTLIINVTGSLVIGALLTYMLRNPAISQNLRLVFVVGFLGAYTTFSTYTFDSLTLFQNGEVLKGLIYFLGTAFLGMVSVSVGMLVGRSV